jgi:hypothetical protein
VGEDSVGGFGGCSGCEEAVAELMARDQEWSERGERNEWGRVSGLGGYGTGGDLVEDRRAWI